MKYRICQITQALLTFNVHWAPGKSNCQLADEYYVRTQYKYV